jgi:hypothetical protein
MCGQKCSMGMEIGLTREERDACASTEVMLGEQKESHLHLANCVSCQLIGFVLADCKHDQAVCDRLYKTFTGHSGNSIKGLPIRSNTRLDLITGALHVWCAVIFAFPVYHDLVQSVSACFHVGVDTQARNSSTQSLGQAL